MLLSHPLTAGTADPFGHAFRRGSRWRLVFQSPVSGVSRSDSEKWDILGNAGSMMEEVTPADIGALSFVSVVARWQGMAVENFSGEEAAGSVTVRCMFSEL